MGKRTYTGEHNAFLKRYPILDRVILTAIFNKEFGENRNVEQIRCHCRRGLGMKMVNTKRFGHGQVMKVFKKGEYAKGSEKSWFKAGHDIKTCGIGHEYKHGKFIKIKITNENKQAAKNFTAKHRWVWEQHHGKIPEGMVVSFLDNDPTNCNIDNLICVERGEFTRLVKSYNFQNERKELKPSIMAISKLENMIK